MSLKKWLIGIAAAVLLCGTTIPAIASEAVNEMDTCSVTDEADTLEDGDTAAYTVTVALSQGNLAMYYMGQTAALTATVTSSDAPNQPMSDVSVAWTSSNTSAVTVNDNGEVTAVGNGNAEISVSAITVGGSTYQVTGSTGEEGTGTAPVVTSASCAVTVNLYTGFYETAENSKTVYYYYDEGVLMTDTVQNGKAFGETAWWYVDANGRASKSYTGFAANQNGTWYLNSGKVTFKENCVIQDKTGAIGSKGIWYYVTGSKVQYNYTGLADYSNENGWWYIRNGKVDFTANTVAKNKNGWWYVTGGKVQFGFTGLGNYGNANGWWYIKNGKVDFTVNTVAQNKNGWWYVKGGKVQFGYTGIGTNSNGTWYIENGKVNFSYTGWKTINGSKYYIVNGRVSLDGRIMSGGNLYYFNSSGVLTRTVYGNQKMVALTYDDGPSIYTATILDTLEKYNSAATFFVVGSRVNTYASTAKRAYSMGCQIGNHTYNHTILTSVSASTIRSQISRTNSVVKSVIGVNPTVMRPPGGGVNSTVKSTVGMPIILWSVDTLDWKTRNASSTINAVLNKAQDGDIILMHDLYSATATASQTIIPSLVNRGYQLVTVEEMELLRGGLENGVTYSSFR
ncbi:MAG: polysaccharide deacetylase family protein [Lachnospiraceae bacterium]|nr:polysaccharide deacetylase family protein [Lachnospiraceae bacterium]